MIRCHPLPAPKTAANPLPTEPNTTEERPSGHSENRP